MPGLIGIAVPYRVLTLDDPLIKKTIQTIESDLLGKVEEYIVYKLMFIMGEA